MEAHCPLSARWSTIDWADAAPAPTCAARGASAAADNNSKIKKCHFINEVFSQRITVQFF